MIRVLGGPKRLCDGMTRRDLLHVGSIGLLGLGLERLSAPVVAEAPRSGASRLPGFGRAKSCIMIFLYGSPSQLETFDPKPDAPVEIRGEFGTIETSLPGVRFCEGLPELAKVADKMTILRSVSHPYPVHGVAFAATGNPRMELAWEACAQGSEPLAVHRLGGGLRGWPGAAGRSAAAATQLDAALGFQLEPGGGSRACRAVWRVPGFGV